MTSSHWQVPPIAKLSTAAIHGFSRRCSSTSESNARQVVAAVHLRDLAELALEHELDERDLALVEVREVDARAEDAPARVLVVGGRARRAARPRGCRRRAARGRSRPRAQRSRRRPRSSGRRGSARSRGRSRRHGRPASGRDRRCRPAGSPRSRASASAVGCDIECIRWKPARGCASTCATKMPWLISSPCLSFCSSSRSAAMSRAARQLLGELLGGGVHELGRRAAACGSRP